MSQDKIEGKEEWKKGDIVTFKGQKYRVVREATTDKEGWNLPYLLEVVE